MGAKGNESQFARLSDAVATDCRNAFAAMRQARPNEQPYGLALCIDNDAQSFYVMANTIEGALENENRGRAIPFTLERLKADSFFYNPADWCFSYTPRALESDAAMGAIWSSATDGEAAMASIHRAIIDGLKKFDASGAFSGPRSRNEMVLTLWQTDPDHPEWVIAWAKELNPPQAFDWFRAGYPYEPD